MVKVCIYWLHIKKLQFIEFIILFLAILEGPSSTQKTLEGCNINVSLSKAREKQINNALIKMVVADLQPLSIVENEGFKLFSKALNPAFVVPSRYILTKTLLKNNYDAVFKNLKEELSFAEHICITTDAWTSIANESYVSITAHFITKDWKLNSKFLNCFAMYKDHTAQNLMNEIFESLKKWNVESKISCVVSDNAANILAAIKLAGWYSLPCFAHTLHLIVTDGLKDENIIQLVNKCKAAVEFFNRSTKAFNKLKEMQEQMGKPKLKLINSTPTRWNSTLKMIERLIEIQDVLEATVAILHKPVELFTFEEWQVLKELCNILRPFNEITIEMSAEKFTTVSKLIVLIRGLQSFLSKKKSENNIIIISTLLERFINNVTKRFHRLEYNEILAISTFLDPRFKSKGFTDTGALKYVKDKIYSMYFIPSSDISSPQKNAENNNSIWNEFDQRTNVKTNTSKCIIELNNFAHESIVERKSDPLEWWKSHETVYPGLSAIAKKYLPIVATSVPSERVFSTAGQVLTDRRNSLSSENVEKILFLHFNNAEEN